MNGYSIRLSILFPILILSSIILSMLVAGVLHPGEDGSGRAYGIVAGLSFVIVPSLLHGAAGWLLNAERTPDGLQWSNRYQIGSIPVQFAGIPYALFGWAIVAYNIGTSTSAWLGWPVFVLGPVAVGVGAAQLRKALKRRTAKAT
nr:hypothetical protein [Micromonospora sp. DSM 115978]